MSSVLHVTCDLCGEQRVRYAEGWKDIHDVLSFKETYQRDFCPTCWHKVIGKIEEMIESARRDRKVPQ